MFVCFGFMQQKSILTNLCKRTVTAGTKGIVEQLSLEKDTKTSLESP